MRLWQTFVFEVTPALGSQKRFHALQMRQILLGVIETHQVGGFSQRAGSAR